MTADPTFAVIDIDGVLADVRHRLSHLSERPKDWDAFFAAAPDDLVLPQGHAVAVELGEKHELVYLTGRPERCRRDTEHWLEQNDFPTGRLIMRRNTDRRPARRTKLDELAKLQRAGQVAILVDDDERVVEAATAAGYQVLHAGWMTEEPVEQESLFRAQETEGRT